MFRKTFSLRLLHCYDVKLLWWKIESYFKDRANLLRPWKPTYFIREKSASLKNFFTNNYYFHWKKSRDIAFEKEERVNELPKNLEIFGEKLLSMNIYNLLLLCICLSLSSPSSNRHSVLANYRYRDAFILDLVSRNFVIKVIKVQS